MVSLRDTVIPWSCNNNNKVGVLFASIHVVWNSDNSDWIGNSFIMLVHEKFCLIVVWIEHSDWILITRKNSFRLPFKSIYESVRIRWISDKVPRSGIETSTEIVCLFVFQCKSWNSPWAFVRGKLIESQSLQLNITLQIQGVAFASASG